MGSKLYKYVGASYLDKVFRPAGGLTFKCSLPKDFNDPYELFLTIDFMEDPGALAFYSDLIGQLPQQPTTCFSRSPEVIPMWAHYAENHGGFVLELDEKRLQEAFPESGFGDIDYQNSPNEGNNDLLWRAYEIGKGRHLYLLRNAMYSSAYYSKAECWGYELERRMIVSRQNVRVAEELFFIDVPRDCVTAIIAGARSSSVTVSYLREKAHEIEARFYELRIGRSSIKPYFVDSDEHTHSYRDGEISRAEFSCSSCMEPLTKNLEACSWCRITDDHKTDAAARNTFRMYAAAGMLEEYLQGMDDIRDGRKK